MYITNTNELLCTIEKIQNAQCQKNFIQLKGDISYIYMSF